MSVEFRVAVKPGSKKAFRETISSLEGVRILPSREEVVRRHLEKHRRLIESLNKPKSPKVEAKIMAGYEQMLKDLREGLRDIRKVSPDLDIPKLREITNQLLTESTKAHAGIVDTVRNRVSWKSSSWGKLTPFSAQILIYRYGLIDGVRRSYSEVSRSMGFKRGAYNERDLWRGLASVTWPLEVQKLLTRSPRQSAS